MPASSRSTVAQYLSGLLEAKCMAAAGNIRDSRTGE